MSNKVVIANPFYEKHISMYEQFERANNLEDSTSRYLKNISSSTTESSYVENNKNNPLVKEHLFLEERGVIKDSCCIDIEKDTKFAKLEFTLFTHKYKERLLVDEVISYATNTPEINSIAILVNEEDKSLITILKQKGIESLGSENGVEIFIVDTEIPAKESRDSVWKH